MEKARGLIMVHTGDGKGKTTAALGCALRSLGHDMNVLVIEFVKHIGRTGEHKMAERIPQLEFYAAPEPPSGTPQEKDRHRAQGAWEFTKQELHARRHEMIILDAINVAIDQGYVDIEDVVKVLRTKPRHVHLFLTGRNAKQEIIDHADLVTEMKEIRHPHGKGVKAQRGIEF